MEIIINLKKLKIPSTEVSNKEEAKDIINKLDKTFTELINRGKNGFGLAAVQVGIYRRVSIIRMPNGLKVNLVNPKIILKELPITFNESCYSLPGLVIKTDRYRYIQIENNCNKDEHIVEAYSDLEAIVIQHEIDHMDGRTILNRKHRKK